MIKINLIAEGRKPVVARKGGRDVVSKAAGLGAGSLSLTDWAFLGALIIGALVAGGWFWMLRGELNDIRSQVEVAQAEVKELEPIIKEVEDYKKRKADLERKIEVIEALKQSQRGPVRIMDEISRALPDLLWLRTLSVKGSTVEITGSAFNTNQVAAFLENLGKVPEFQEPVLKETVRQAGQGQETYTFSINFNFVIAKPAAEADEAGG
jgi:type IV pilus assembly protein PilN